MTALPDLMNSPASVIEQTRQPLPRWWLRKPDRSARVRVLLAGVILMSLLDLHLTLFHMSVIGMLEMNPLARFIVGFGSPALLIAFKMVSIAVTCGSLYFVRNFRLGEIGAVISFVVLAILCLQWAQYNNAVLSDETVTAALMTAEPMCETWVRLP